MEALQSVARKVSEVSDARLGFLKEVMENEVIVPEKDVQVLTSFLANLGLQYGRHFAVSHVRVWFLFEWKWWAKFRLLAPVRLREIRRRGFNRTRVEVWVEGIFGGERAKEA
jgi:hypothetical protein